MLFHLGVIWRLREAGWLERIDGVSSVSGGSITAAVLALGWDGDFQEQVVAPVRGLARRQPRLDRGARGHPPAGLDLGQGGGRLP